MPLLFEYLNKRKCYGRVSIYVIHAIWFVFFGNDFNGGGHRGVLVLLGKKAG